MWSEYRERTCMYSQCTGTVTLTACVCTRVCVCARARVRVCVRVCWGGGKLIESPDFVISSESSVVLWLAPSVVPSLCHSLPLSFPSLSFPPFAIPSLCRSLPLYRPIPLSFPPSVVPPLCRSPCLSFPPSIVPPTPLPLSVHVCRSFNQGPDTEQTVGMIDVG